MTRKRMLNYIRKYHEEHGYMPTYREISNGVGIYSLESIHYQMNVMFNMGMLETEHRGCPRAYRLGRKSNE